MGRNDRSQRTDRGVEKQPMSEQRGPAKADGARPAKGRTGAPPLSNLPTPARGSRGGRAGDASAGVSAPGDHHTQPPRARGAGSALEDLMRRRGVDEAWNALEEMQRHGVAADKFTVSRMLTKTVGDGRMKITPQRVYRGIALVERFVELQPRDVDEVLFNALLDTCCRLKDLKRLEATMGKMRELNVAPSPVTLGVLVKTYGQAGDLQRVLHVWDEMEKQRGQANAVTYGCMIDACVKCGSLSKAVEIFEGMRKTGKHRNTILYTTLIKGYGAEKDLESALHLFHEMPREGVEYNTITYNSILDACIKGGDLPTAESLLRQMTSPDSVVEPDLITFSTLLKGYCHIGDLDRALQVAEAIKARGLRCDELVYNTLMDGCVKAGDFSAGIGLFEEMVQTGMRPSAITHSILARLYQRAGYEDDASEAVAQLYQHVGIERPSAAARLGCKGGMARRWAGPAHSFAHAGGDGCAGSQTAAAAGGSGKDAASWASWGASLAMAAAPSPLSGGYGAPPTPPGPAFAFGTSGAGGGASPANSSSCQSTLCGGGDNASSFARPATQAWPQAHRPPARPSMAECSAPAAPPSAWWGGGNSGGSSCGGPNGCSGAWDCSGTVALKQAAPFPMPLSPPHDARSQFATNAYFEGWHQAHMSGNAAAPSHSFS